MVHRMKYIARMIASIFCAGVLLAPGLVVAQNFDDPLASTCGQNSKASVCQTNDTKILGADGVLVKVSRAVALLTGVASVIMIMVGGFKYIISSGDSANINSAKNTILYALLGLAISVTAPLIIGFVVKKL
jgi:hypothetical protein